MTNAAPLFTKLQSLHRSWILRIIWDDLLHTWQLQLKPVNGEAERLFSDGESLLHYLEGMMQEKQAHNKQ